MRIWLSEYGWDDVVIQIEYSPTENQVYITRQDSSGINAVRMDTDVILRVGTDEFPQYMFEDFPGNDAEDHIYCLMVGAYMSLQALFNARQVYKDILKSKNPPATAADILQKVVEAYKQGKNYKGMTFLTAIRVIEMAVSNIGVEAKHKCLKVNGVSDDEIFLLTHS